MVFDYKSQVTVPCYQNTPINEYRKILDGFISFGIWNLRLWFIVLRTDGLTVTPADGMVICNRSSLFLPKKIITSKFMNLYAINKNK